MSRRFKPTLLAIMLLILAIGISGCPPAPEEEAERERETTTTERPTTTTERPTTTTEVREKTVTVNRTEVVNGLQVEVTEIVIESDEVSVGMNLENQSSNPVSFFPDQGDLLIDNMQLEANTFATRGDVSGTIVPGGTKSGTIIFDVPGDRELAPGQITRVELFLGDVFDEETFESESFEMTIDVPQE